MVVSPPFIMLCLFLVCLPRCFIQCFFVPPTLPAVGWLAAWPFVTSAIIAACMASDSFLIASSWPFNLSISVWKVALFSTAFLLVNASINLLTSCAISFFIFCQAVNVSCVFAFCGRVFIFSKIWLSAVYSVSITSSFSVLPVRDKSVVNPCENSSTLFPSSPTILNSCHLGISTKNLILCANASSLPITARIAASSSVNLVASPFWLNLFIWSSNSWIRFIKSSFRAFGGAAAAGGVVVLAPFSAAATTPLIEFCNSVAAFNRASAAAFLSLGAGVAGAEAGCGVSAGGGSWSAVCELESAVEASGCALASALEASGCVLATSVSLDLTLTFFLASKGTITSDSLVSSCKSPLRFTRGAGGAEASTDNSGADGSALISNNNRTLSRFSSLNGLPDSVISFNAWFFSVSFNALITFLLLFNFSINTVYPESFSSCGRSLYAFIASNNCSLLSSFTWSPTLTPLSLIAFNFSSTCFWKPSYLAFFAGSLCSCLIFSLNVEFNPSISGIISSLSVGIGSFKSINALTSVSSTGFSSLNFGFIMLTAAR